MEAATSSDKFERSKDYLHVGELFVEKIMTSDSDLPKRFQEAFARIAYNDFLQGEDRMEKMADKVSKLVNKKQFTHHFLSMFGQYLLKNITATSEDELEKEVTSFVKSIELQTVKQLVDFIKSILSGVSEEYSDLTNQHKNMHRLRSTIDVTKAEVDNCMLLDPAELHQIGSFSLNEKRVLPPGVDAASYTEHRIYGTDSVVKTAGFIQGFDSKKRERFNAHILMQRAKALTAELTGLYKKVLTPEIKKRFPLDRAAAITFAFNPATSEYEPYYQTTTTIKKFHGEIVTLEFQKTAENLCLEILLSLVVGYTKAGAIKTPKPVTATEFVKAVTVLTKSIRESEDFETLTKIQLRIPKKHQPSSLGKIPTKLITWLEENSPESELLKLLKKEVWIAVYNHSHSATDYDLHLELGNKSYEPEGRLYIKVHSDKVQATLYSGRDDDTKMHSLKPPVAEVNITKLPDGTVTDAEKRPTLLTSMQKDLRELMDGINGWPGISEGELNEAEKNHFIRHATTALMNILLMNIKQNGKVTDKNIAALSDHFTFSDFYGGTMEQANARLSPPYAQELPKLYPAYQISSTANFHKKSAQIAAVINEKMIAKVASTKNKGLDISNDIAVATKRLKKPADNTAEKISIKNLSWRNMFKDPTYQYLLIKKLLEDGCTSEDIKKIMAVDAASIEEKLATENEAEYTQLLTTDLETLKNWGSALELLKSVGQDDFITYLDNLPKKSPLRAQIAAKFDELLLQGRNHFIDRCKGKPEGRFTGISDLLRFYFWLKKMCFKVDAQWVDKLKKDIQKNCGKDKHAATILDGLFKQTEKIEAELEEPPKKGEAKNERKERTKVGLKETDISTFQKRLAVTLHLKYLYEKNARPEDMAKLYADKELLNAFIRGLKETGLLSFYLKHLLEIEAIYKNPVIKKFWMQWMQDNINEPLIIKPKDMDEPVILQDESMDEAAIFARIDKFTATMDAPKEASFYYSALDVLGIVNYILSENNASPAHIEFIKEILNHAPNISRRIETNLRNYRTTEHEKEITRLKFATEPAI